MEGRIIPTSTSMSTSTFRRNTALLVLDLAHWHCDGPLAYRTIYNNMTYVILSYSVKSRGKKTNSHVIGLEFMPVLSGWTLLRGEKNVDLCWLPGRSHLTGYFSTLSSILISSCVSNAFTYLLLWIRECILLWPVSYSRNESMLAQMRPWESLWTLEFPL